MRCCARELRSPRPLVSPFVKYSEETASELAIFRAAAKIRKTYGPGAIRTSDHLQDAGRLGHARTRAAAEGSRARHRRRAAPELNIVPLFETIDDLRACVGVMDRLLSLPEYRRLVDEPRRRAGSDARLFRLQQGRRLRHLGLGALQGRDRPRRSVQAPRRAHPAVPRPRRLGRPRRRPELRRHSRPARRRRAGPDPHHRTGRNHLEQIFQRRSRPAQS